jgi:hypothetical protein
MQYTGDTGTMLIVKEQEQNQQSSVIFSGIGIVIPMVKFSKKKQGDLRG